MFAQKVSKPEAKENARGSSSASHSPQSHLRPVRAPGQSFFSARHAAPSPFLQTKLIVGAVDDPMESEADRVAHAIMSKPEAALPSQSSSASLEHRSSVQRCGCSGSAKPCAKCQSESTRDEDETKIVHRASRASRFDGTLAPGIVAEVLSEPGQPLDAHARAFLEPRFGFSLSNIRIHHDAKAADSASSVMARAYATGSHLVFNRGQYNPHSHAGRHLIAHELAHVVQQGAALRTSIQPPHVQRSPWGTHNAPLRDSPMGSPPAGVPAEKWSENAEAAYRKAGQVEAANAVNRCRNGDCSKILLTKETRAALLLGRHAANLPLDGSSPRASSAGSGSVARSVSGIVQRFVPEAADAVIEAELENATALYGPATVVEGGAGAGAGVGVAAVALPLALGAVIIVSLVALASEAALQEALRAQGFVILPDILGVCISNCHQPDAPRFNDKFRDLLDHDPMPDPRQYFPDLTDPRPPSGNQRYRMTPVPTPAPKPQPGPDPKPKPKTKDKEKRKDCQMTPRAVGRGDDPLASLFCEEASGGGPSVDIWSTVGSAEIDALRGRVWFECKCGYLSTVRAFNKGVPWAKAAMMGGKRDNSKLGLFEQIQRQMRIAQHCNLQYRVVVANEEVAKFFRDQFPSLTVDVKSFDPCEG